MTDSPQGVKATERPWNGFGLTGFAMEQFKYERLRQVRKEGWTAEHDDAHEDGELLRAGISYFMHAKHGYGQSREICDHPFNWPWEKRWWKPSTPIRDLEKAGGLALAEKEKCLRKSPRAYVGHCDQKLELFAALYAELIVRAVNSHDALVKALEEAKAKFEKVADWLDRLSAASKDQAKTSERFESLKEACLADARNYAGTAKSIRSEVANIDAALSTSGAE